MSDRVYLNSCACHLEIKKLEKQLTQKDAEIESIKRRLEVLSIPPISWGTVQERENEITQLKEELKRERECVDAILKDGAWMSIVKLAEETQAKRKCEA